MAEIEGAGQALRDILARGTPEAVSNALRDHELADLAVALARMSDKDRVRVLQSLPPGEAARLLGQLPDHCVAEIVAHLPLETAAHILEQLPEDRQADILARLTTAKEEEILHALSPEDAKAVERLLTFAPDTAGGLMITEFLAYPEDWTVDDVVEDLRAHADEYARYDVQYVYVVDRRERLTGVLRLRDLLMAPRNTKIADIMVRNPVAVRTSASIRELLTLFKERPLLGLPVTDEEGRLLGVVRRVDVEQAAAEETGRTFLRLVGILSGEELRTDPLPKRLGGRTVWLITNLLLDLVAASVIALYQDVLAAVISLAVFLPIISDMGGNSGVQSVAVTVREMTMGLIRSRDYKYVLLREIPLGALAGVVLALFGAAVAYVWTGQPLIALVFATALLANTIWSVCVGSTLPLFVHRVGLDPALASGPILTTLTDMFGFFVALEMARNLIAGGS